MKFFLQLGLISLALASAIPHDESTVLEKRVTRSGTATITMTSASGTASQLAAGLLNGIPPNDFSSYIAGTPPSTAAVQTQIPDYLISGLGPKNLRGGAANLPAPSRGWLYGFTEYQVSHTSFITDEFLTLTHSESIPRMAVQLPHRP